MRLTETQVKGSNMTSPNGHTSARGAQTTSRTVVGLFNERSRAEEAIRDLKEAGFSDEQIGVVTRDRTAPTGQPTDSSGQRRGASPDEEELGKVVEDTAGGMAEGASIGAITGGVIGGLVGLIGSLLVPGLGPVLVGGVLASTLMGMGLGAATGGLIGALVGMGVPEQDARYFDAGFREGGTLVTVNAGERTPEAVSTLQRCGGDLGPSRSSPAERPAARYQGSERRNRRDVSYSGPERRLVGV
jgi:hypothetical protein